MRVLITGGAGFIAHHLIAKILKETDWEIVTLDRLDYSGNLNRLHDLISHDIEFQERNRINVIFHDLKAELNPMLCKKIGNVDYIFHLAAGSHVDRSIENPMEFVLDNVVGTCNILNFARTQNDLKRFIYFSTDEVFGPALGGVKFKENDRYNSTNPYSATKAGGEELAVAYENTYNIPVSIMHTMNVFGERQHPEKYIPMCIRKIRDGELIKIHSDSTKSIPGSRHYVHVEDVADATLFIARMTKFEKAETRCPKFNIVGPEEFNNLELAQFIANVQNKTLKYEMVDFHSSRPGHDLRYSLDGTKMKNLGWEPKPVRDRLQKVVEWSLANSRWL